MCFWKRYWASTLAEKDFEENFWAQPRREFTNKDWAFTAAERWPMLRAKHVRRVQLRRAGNNFSAKQQLEPKTEQVTIPLLLEAWGGFGTLADDSAAIQQFLGCQCDSEKSILQTNIEQPSNVQNRFLKSWEVITDSLANQMAHFKSMTLACLIFGDLSGRWVNSLFTVT